jgi:hypothetical protein
VYIQQEEGDDNCEGKYGLKALWNEYFSVVKSLPKSRSKFSVSIKNYNNGPMLSKIFLIGGINSQGNVIK